MDRESFSPINPEVPEEGGYSGPESFADQPEVAALERGSYPEPGFLESLENIKTDVDALFEEGGLSPLKGAARLKSAISLEDKIELFSSHQGTVPIPDIYGLRFVFESPEDVEKAVGLLRARWPTPDLFPWGLPTVRRAPIGSYSSPHYNVTRVNLVCDTKIVEVQLMTPEQEEMDRATREEYESRKGKRRGG